jgi:hypothetical protein
VLPDIHNSEYKTSSVSGHMTLCSVNFRMKFLSPISSQIKTAISLKTLLLTDQTTRPLITEDPYFIHSLLLNVYEGKRQLKSYVFFVSFFVFCVKV